MMMMMTAMSCTTAHAQSVEWPGIKGEEVDISLCKKAVKKGHFLAEFGSSMGFSLYYQHGDFLYRQYFDRGHKLYCTRWAEKD